MTQTTEPPNEAAWPCFGHYLFYAVDPAWRRLTQAEREQGRAAFREVLERDGPVRTFTYSTTGLKADADLMLWRLAGRLEDLQDQQASLADTGLGRYLRVAHVLWGMTRPSSYTRRTTPQEQAVHTLDRLPYLTVYPFSKTAEWYLMSRDARQGLMNEHMRVGHEYARVRQVLLYAFGLDDHEFVIAYETDDLQAYQSLLMALRATEVRRYTLKDQPIFTAIHRSPEAALALLG